MLSRRTTVSHFCAASFAPIFYILRLVGLLPFTFTTDARYGFMCFSPTWAIYSITFCAVFLALMIGGTIADLQLGNQIQDGLVVDLFNIAQIIVFYACGVLTIITRRRAFLMCLAHLTQADKLLKMSADGAAAARRVAIRLIVIALLCMTVVLGIAMPFVNTLYCLPYLVSNYLFVLVSTQYAVMMDGFRRRACALAAELVAPCNGVERYFYADHVSRVTLVFEHISAAMTLFNDVYGPIILLAFINLMMNMIIAPYNVYLSLSSLSSEGITPVLLDIAWCLFQIARLMILIEPTHRNTDELTGLNPLVAKLMMLDVDKETRKQLHTLALHLQSSVITFEPCGMFTINRGMLTTIIGTVTTYLIILINFNRDTEL